MAYKQPSSGPFKMMGSSPAKRKPVTKEPKTEGKEIKIKTNSSKLYGVDWEGHEPPVTDEDKNFGLNNAKKKAKKDVAKTKKGKELSDANDEIDNYTDY